MESLTELINGLKIYQYEDEFKFSVDAVLLADFIEVQKNKKILEVGGGTGVIPLLLIGKNKIENSSITVLEIQEKMAELIKKNIIYNKCDEKIEVLNCDFKTFKKGNFYDVIFSNPPYMTMDGKELNISLGKRISRHEVCLTLEELVENAKRVLKPRGDFYLVHRAYRIQEILTILSKYSFEVEKLQFLYHDKESNGNLVLIKCTKGMKKILTVAPPKYINN